MHIGLGVGFALVVYQVDKGRWCSNITELSQIEHRRILGRRAINCDCPRHSSAVLLICDFANSRTYGEAWDRGLCTHESRDHLEERWLAAWLSRSWFCTDDKSAKTRSRFCHRRKDAGGSCMRRSIFVSDYRPRVRSSSMRKLTSITVTVTCREKYDSAGPWLQFYQMTIHLRCTTD